MQALEDGSDDNTAAPLDPVTTRALVDEPRMYDVGMNKHKAMPSLPRAASEKTTSRTFSEGLWARVRGEQAEEEEAQERVLPPTRPPPARPIVSHTRSASQPIKLSQIPWKADFATRPEMERANTPGSTPGSDGTDRGLPSSTAPTTAGITPAALSNRASAHQRTKSADTKISVVDGDWMRRELERHRQAQEEDNARQRLDDQFQSFNRDSEAFSPSTTIGDAMSPVVQDAQTMQVTKATAPAVRVPARKPVPRATLNGDTAKGADSRTSGDLRRSMSQKRRSTPRSESRAELEFLESSRQSREQSRAPPSEPETPITVPYTTRPYNGVRAPAPSANISQAPSRSRSITRQIREFVRRPSISSRKPSGEISRPESRSRSIDSTRSAVSAMSSTDVTSSRWKSWWPFHRAQSSTTSLDDCSGGEMGRGRDSMQQGKAKPPINLNRELPPLPSLDQWKDDDDEPQPPVPSMPRHVTNISIDTFATALDTPSPGTTTAITTALPNSLNRLHNLPTRAGLRPQRNPTSTTPAPSSKTHVLPRRPHEPAEIQGPRLPPCSRPDHSAFNTRHCTRAQTFTETRFLNGEENPPSFIGWCGTERHPPPPHHPPILHTLSKPHDEQRGGAEPASTASASGEL